jgi:hypothetical protein
MFSGMRLKTIAADAVLPAYRRRAPLRAGGALFALVAATLLAGCGGGSDAKRLGDYLDEIEFDEPLESAAYVSLGTFDVPTPTRVKRDGVSRTMWIRLSFELFAESAPHDESTVAAAAEKRHGALNDALLTIIRTSSTDELTDPRLSALKLRMTEAAKPLLGDHAVRQLVLYNIRTELM